MQDKVITAFLLLFILLLIYHQTYFNNEYFVLNPSVSNVGDISDGASEYYNWGYKTQQNDQIPHVVHTCNKCQNKCYIPVPYKRNEYPCPHCKERIRIKNEFNFIKQNSCTTCDITQNKDIGKYVLKSSVPPCPDMSQYLKKTTLLPQDPTQGGKYILKSDCPKCPVCPICPQCPNGYNGNNSGSGNGSGNGLGLRLDADFGFDYSSNNNWGYNEPGMKNVTIPKDGSNMSRQTMHISKKVGRPILDDTISENGNNSVKAYEPPFAYSNRGSSKVYAYNKFNPDWGNGLGWSFNPRG